MNDGAGKKCPYCRTFSKHVLAYPRVFTSAEEKCRVFAAFKLSVNAATLNNGPNSAQLVSNTLDSLMAVLEDPLQALLFAQQVHQRAQGLNSRINVVGYFPPHVAPANANANVPPVPAANVVAAAQASPRRSNIISLFGRNPSRNGNPALVIPARGNPPVANVTPPPVAARPLGQVPVNGRANRVPANARRPLDINARPPWRF